MRTYKPPRRSNNTVMHILVLAGPPAAIPGSELPGGYFRRPVELSRATEKR